MFLDNPENGGSDLHCVTSLNTGMFINTGVRPSELAMWEDFKCSHSERMYG